MTDTGGSAFPTAAKFSYLEGCEPALITEENEGVTWLDLCAMMAMQGLIANGFKAPTLEEPKDTNKRLAGISYAIAQAMPARKRELENE